MKHYIYLALIAIVVLLVPTFMLRCTRIDSSEEAGSNMIPMINFNKQ